MPQKLFNQSKICEKLQKWHGGYERRKRNTGITIAEQRFFKRHFAVYERREDIDLDDLDFFNQYIMGSMQMFTGFYFYTRFLKKKIKPVYYFLFTVLGITVIQSVRAGKMAEFMLYILLLSISGFLICRIWNISVILYAVIIVEIMQFTFGIFNSALCILYPSAGMFNQEITGILFMVLGYFSLPVTALCCCIADQFFSYDETAKNQYTLMLLTPALMIFLTGEYINSAIYGNTIVTDSSGMISDTNHYQMLIIQILGAGKPVLHDVFV